MKAIVNVSPDWGIGKNGDLLVHIPEDMKRFRRLTKGKVVVEGLNTLKSFPGMKPLPGRVNIVLAEDLSMIPEESIRACDCYIDDTTKDVDPELFGRPEATVMFACTSLGEALEIICMFPGDDVFVCGGASVYKLLLPWCDTALVTKNDCTEKADTFYPNLDEDPGWEIAETEEEQEYEGIRFRNITYRRKDV